MDEYVVGFSLFKEQPIFEIRLKGKPADSYPLISFGLRKAVAILLCLEELRGFVRRNTKEEFQAVPGTEETKA